MRILLFDYEVRKNFLPLTFTRSLADVYAGAMTIKGWWQKIAGEEIYIHTEKYLRSKYAHCPDGNEYIYINASVVPDEQLWKLIQTLNRDEALLHADGKIIAFNSKENYQHSEEIVFPSFNNSIIPAEFINHPSDLIGRNSSFFNKQVSLLNGVSINEKISKHNILINPDNIFVDEGCTILGATLNASTGPVYISKNCIIMEGSCIRGPFFMGENSVVKMGAQIYGATSIGKKCAVGGELKNVIIHDFTNKSHHGYLGDSIIGSWCNFGAGTSVSNMKNTASDVNLYNYSSSTFEKAGLKFGTITGDYTRTAINTSINSGTSIGVSCNVFDHPLSTKLIKNFTWGNSGENSYQLEKSIKHLQNWMRFKDEQLREADEEVLEWIWNVL